MCVAVLNAVSQFAFCFIFSAFSAVMGHADDKEEEEGWKGGRGGGNAMDLLLVFMAAEKAINRTKSIFFCKNVCVCARAELNGIWGLQRKCTKT